MRITPLERYFEILSGPYKLTMIFQLGSLLKLQRRPLYFFFELWLPVLENKPKMVIFQGKFESLEPRPGPGPGPARKPQS